MNKYFDQDLKEIAEYMKIDYEDLKQKIKEYYNGYNFGDEQDKVYNPWDINSFMINRRI